MRVLAVLSSFFLGSSLAGNLLNKIIPDVDFDNEDCIGDACFLRNQVMNVDRSKTDPTTNLAYNERSLAYINTQNLLAICLPGVAKESAADSFTSCTGKPMEEICVFAKRKWLVKDAQNETVADLAFLSTAFSGFFGDEAVKKCMKIKEEEEATDDYYVYEYDYDYYDYYDYLEEAGGIEVRRKRDAGKGDKKGGKKGKGGKNNIGRKDRKDNKKNGKNNAGKGKNTGKNDNGNGKRGNKKDTRKGKKAKGKNAKGKGNKGARNGKNAKGKGNKGARNGKNAKGKNAKGKGNKGARNGKKDTKKGNKDGNGKKGKGKQDNKATERKFVKPKNPSKKPSKENEAKTSAQLNKLGFSKMPTKSTLSELECMWGELEDLLVKCGENIISNSP